MPPLLEATHLPPLLTAPGERVDLRYDVFCAVAGDEGAAGDRPCEATGRAFVRPGDSGAFQALPLRVDPSAAEGRYVASVPASIASSPDGFSYYAAFDSPSSGSIELPAGGAAAPQRSLPLGRAVEIHLGAHVFGRTQMPDAVVARAAWGDGPGEVGLEQGRNLTPMGGSSFDVDAAGNVSLLDEAHRRLLRWHGATGPTSTPLDIAGTLADLAVADDGRIYVLDATGPSDKPVLREFSGDGSDVGSVDSAERASQVRLGPDGPVLLQEPSNEWTDAASTGGKLLSPGAQRLSGRAGRPLPSGGDVIMLRRGNEIRLALVSGRGAVRSWRVTSDTPLAEVQLVEPLGKNLLVVARVYTDDRDEFVALVLGSKGLVRSFSLDSADWAETSPLTRFRLVGDSLYQLGSTPAEVFVDRFDLKGAS